MSLTTDLFFYRVLSESDVYDMTEGRIFNPARTTIDEEQDRIPYVIITFESLENMVESKDDNVEGPEDRVVIGILCVAENREALADLTIAVREAVYGYYQDVAGEAYDSAPEEYTISAKEIQYDPTKPCCYQQLFYSCITLR